MPPPTDTPGGPTRPGKLFRRFRRTVRVAAVLLLLLPVALAVLTQGPVPRWLVARSVRKATGADFHAQWVSLQLDGRFVATDATLTAPPGSGLDGPAAQLAAAKRVEVNLDWSAWAAGVVAIESVNVVSPTVRISLDTVSGMPNFATLNPGPTGSSSIAKVPRIDVQQATVILAEHARGSSQDLITLSARGWLTPITGSSRYMLHLSGSDRSDPAMTLDLRGEVDLATLSGQVRSSPLELSRWTPAKVPTPVRQIWSQLQMRGSIDATTLRYAPGQGAQLELTLNDVALAVPIASGRPGVAAGTFPQMKEVSGSLRLIGAGPGQGLAADLTGIFEDLPAHVSFSTSGLSLDAAYRSVITAERFKLEKDPRILLFTPEVVQKNFDRFSGPTAIIDARIELARTAPSQPGVPGETSISGTLVFEQGAAAYGVFPYPLTAMAGTVRFDDERVRIVGVSGRGPTGARIFAEGTIEPPTRDSSYDIRVIATDVPIDDVLRNTLLASRGAPAVDSVFSQQRLTELIQAGLVVLPGTPPASAPQITPRFSAFAGTIDSLQIHVTSEFGREQPVHQNIAVRFNEVSILPREFPMPLRGVDVSARIGDDYVAVSGRGVSGLRGGTADVDALVYTRHWPGQAPRTSVIKVSAESFPIEPLLINAIPKTSADAGGFSIGTMLNTLRLDGPVDADITLTLTQGQDVPGFDATVVFEGVMARPAPASLPFATVPLVLDSLVGAIHVTNDHLDLGSLEGIVQPREIEAAFAGPPVPTLFRLDGQWALASRPGTPRGALEVNLYTKDLDTTLGFEDLLAPIVPAAATALNQMRSSLKPSGRIDLDVQVQQPTGPSEPMNITATLSNAENMQITAGQQRVELLQARGDPSRAVMPSETDTPEEGTLVVRAVIPPQDQATLPPRLQFNALKGTLRIDQQTVGQLQATGTLSLPDERYPLLVHEPFEATMRGMLLQSQIIRDLSGRFGGPSVASIVSALDPEGVLDGEIKLVPDPAAADPARWSPWIALRPESLVINAPGASLPIGVPPARWSFPLISGQITVDGDAGRFEELTVVEPDWSARFNGTWTRTPDPRDLGTAAAPSTVEALPWRIEGTLAAESAGLPRSLAVLFPESFNRAIADANMQIFGGLAAPNVSVRIDGDAATQGQAPQMRLAGVLEFDGLFADPGLTVHDAIGALDIEFKSAARPPLPGGLASTTIVNILPTRTRLAGLLITGATGRIGFEENGAIDLTALNADAYGGKLSLTAQLRPSASAATDNQPGDSNSTAFSAQLNAAGLRFADLLRDLQRTRSAIEGPLPPDSLRIVDQDLADRPDGSRGLLEAHLALAGTLEPPANPVASLDSPPPLSGLQPAPAPAPARSAPQAPNSSRTGRGEVRIAGGQAVLDLPGVDTVLQLVSLQLPTADPFDYAHADVYIQGDTLHFDRAVLLSDALALYAAGAMDIPSREMDLHVTGRSRTRIPLITDLLDNFREEIVTARVRGQPAKPQLTFENFGAIRSAFQGKENPLSHALRTDLERLERDRQRTLGTAPPAPPPVTRVTPD